MYLGTTPGKYLGRLRMVGKFHKAGMIDMLHKVDMIGMLRMLRSLVRMLFGSLGRLRMAGILGSLFRSLDKLDKSLRTVSLLHPAWSSFLQGLQLDLLFQLNTNHTLDRQTLSSGCRPCRCGRCRWVRHVDCGFGFLF